METTVISSAGLRVSRIGLGCVTFGREIDEAAAHVLLDYAYARGIIFFDTASAYSQGASESILGRWIASRRPAAGSITVATKLLPPYDPERITETVDASLQRLGLAVIDLFYLHRWDATAESPAALALRSMRLCGPAKSARWERATTTASSSKRRLALQQQHGLEPFQRGAEQPQPRRQRRERGVATVLRFTEDRRRHLQSARRRLSDRQAPAWRATRLALRLGAGASGCVFPRAGVSEARAVGSGGRPHRPLPGAPRPGLGAASAGRRFGARRWTDTGASRSSVGSAGIG